MLSLNDWVKLHSDSVAISVTSTSWGGFGLIAKQEVKEGDEVLVLREVNECDLILSVGSRNRNSNCIESSQIRIYFHLLL